MSQRRRCGHAVAFVAGVLTALSLEPVARAQDAPALTAAEGALAAIVTLVQAHTGPAPADCGRFFGVTEASAPTVAQLEAAIQCGRDAASRRVPFWLLAGGRGFDSWIAQGLLAGHDGVIRRFYYDSAPSGGAAGTANFDTARCWLPGVHAYAGGHLDIECANDVWKLVVNAVTLLVSGVALLIGVPLARRGLGQTAATMMLAAAAIVAAITVSLAYEGAGRWITTIPALVCVAALLVMALRAWRRPTHRGAPAETAPEQA